MRAFPKRPILTLVCGIALAAAPARAQQSAPTAARCFKMVYTHDSTDVPLPDHFDGGSPLPNYFRWSPVESQARFWWDSMTVNAREALKRSGSQGSWWHTRDDSVTIGLWSIVPTSGDVRFASFARPVGGIVQWVDEANRPIERHTFVAQAVACPHLD
jgi:hypothetical protein